MGLIYLVASPIVLPRSNVAMTNARIVTVRAPIDGMFESTLNRSTSFIEKGQLFGVIRSSSVDRAQLAQLRAEQAWLAGFTPGLDRQDQRASVAETLNRIGRMIDSEQQRLEDRQSAQLMAPVAGLIWQFGGRDPLYFKEGDVILQIANCTDRLVSATVSEMTYNALSRGQTVSYQPQDGTPKRQGTILELLGPSMMSGPRDLLFHPGSTTQNEFLVTLGLDPLPGGVAEACVPGQTGTVFFTSVDGNWFALPEWFGRLAGVLWRGLDRSTSG